MKALGFAAAGERAGDGRRLVRRMRFESRSSLPTSAACVVANGVRETLGSLFGAPVRLRLLEPSVPAPESWPALLRSAFLYRVRGHAADAAVVLRNADALALAGGVFGESSGGASSERPPSPIERDVIDRIAAAIATNLGAVCGTRDGPSIESAATIGGFVTYFEMLIEEPVRARVGVALSRDPSPEPLGRLDLAQLASVRVPARAMLDLGQIEAAAIASLAPGAVVPVQLADLERCILTAYGRNLARGACGVRRGRYAVTVHATQG
ncbi:MAG: FliM/FliN family flagellar motor switch protein [Candidatus Eremiobacteraeota bacterium]|nr:FliM/FliN family flagellar motor switch protein [Candidatus Eremiobacteraeota bacterium]